MGGRHGFCGAARSSERGGGVGWEGRAIFRESLCLCGGSGRRPARPPSSRGGAAPPPPPGLVRHGDRGRPRANVGRQTDGRADAQAADAMVAACLLCGVQDPAATTERVAETAQAGQPASRVSARSDGGVGWSGGR